MRLLRWIVLFFLVFASMPVQWGNAQDAPVSQRVIVLTALQPGEKFSGKAASAASLAASRTSVWEAFQARGGSARILTTFRGSLLNGYVLDVSAADLDILRQVAGAKNVFVDAPVQAALDDSVAQIGAPEVWKMTDAKGKPVDGRGVIIAIIDSGVDYTHPDLGGCLGPACHVVGGWDFVNQDADPMDDYSVSHGTHVAGIAAAIGDTNPKTPSVRGVAPGAHLLAYKVLDDMGKGYMGDVLAAIERAVVDGANVINLSLAEQNNSNPHDLACWVIHQAVSAGVNVVAAAGNYGQGGTGTVTVPAVCEDAIAVANFTKQDTLHNMSSLGLFPMYPQVSKPDLGAPGTSIFSTMRNGSYGYLTGTSMAAPHVSGATALLRQLHPGWTPQMLVSALVGTAKDCGLLAIQQGAGRIDVYLAAHTPLLALPATINFGRIVSTENHQIIFELRNTRDTPVTVALLVSGVRQYGLDGRTRATEDVSVIGMTLTPATITIPPGKAYPIQLDIHAQGSGFAPGYYEGQISVVFRDPTVAPIHIPLTFWSTIPIQGYLPYVVYQPVWDNP